MYRNRVSSICMMSIFCLLFCRSVFAESKVYRSLEEALEKPDDVYVLDLHKSVTSPLDILLTPPSDLTVLLPEIRHLTNLKELNLSNNALTTLPFEIIFLTNLQRLNLRGNSFATVPIEIIFLMELQELNLGTNQLTTLPPEISSLEGLKKLRLHQNQLLTLPPEIGNLTNLEELSLEDNFLTMLPSETGNLINLKVLDLRWNQLSALPVEIGNLTKLQYLLIEDCGLTETQVSEVKEILPKVEIVESTQTDRVTQRLPESIEQYYQDSGQIDARPRSVRQQNLTVVEVDMEEKNQDLLKFIMGLLTQYPEIGVTIDDFLQYEIDANKVTVEEQIKHRVQFIKFLRNKIASP